MLNIFICRKKLETKTILLIDVDAGTKRVDNKQEITLRVGNNQQLQVLSDDLLRFLYSVIECNYEPFRTSLNSILWICTGCRYDCRNSRKGFSII